jgi:uncharacterized protein YjbI with pentapeptide repeats
VWGGVTTGAVPPSKVIDGCTIVADPTPSHATGADLAGARLESVNLTDADFAGATMWSTFLFDANFSDADLQGVNLKNADTKSPGYFNLTGAHLSDAVLRGATLDGVDIRWWPDAAT